MRITPLDIAGHHFLKKWRGYDAEEVRAFLTQISEEYEKLIVENNRQREDLAKMQSILDEHRGREKILRETLYTAQQVSEDLKEQAQREAKLLLQETQLKADKMLEQAHVRAADLEVGLIDLRAERHGYLVKLRALIDQHMKLLELHEIEATEDGKVKLLKPREETGSTG